MISLLTRFALMLMLVMQTSCSMSADRAPEPISPSAEFDLSVDNLKANEEAANRGDADAAFRLGQYYLFIRDDRDLALRYFSMAAEAGHSKAARALRTLTK